MNTFHQLWGVRTRQRRRRRFRSRSPHAHHTHPKNLEEQALALVGQDVYEKLVEGLYPQSSGEESVRTFRPLLSRDFLFVIPMIITILRIPIEVFRRAAIPVLSRSFWRVSRFASKTDFFANREELTAQADKILFTGMIDEFYDYCYGELEYRSLRF